MAVKSCSIIIPCYNEEKRFPREEFSAFADNNPDLHFVLVNDGSSDGTSQILHAICTSRQHQIQVLDMAQNGGKAEAVRRGLLQALPQSDLVGYWDADLATPLASILSFREILLNQPHLAMVFGARVRILGHQVERQPVRHYLGRVFATVASNLIRLPVYDTQCGAKIFRVTPDTSVLFAQQFQSRWVFDVEIIARYIRQLNYDMARVQNTIYEYPLERWRDVAGSKVKPRDFVKASLELLRIYSAYRQR